ncbi:hypothetical protein HanRHA438_Chr05g0213231 [Helianthus annuus]|nr:hypothetical protein HanRHA438_Chr05g0213231 [Helianthus annuus]
MKKFIFKGFLSNKFCGSLLVRARSSRAELARILIEPSSSLKSQLDLKFELEPSQLEPSSSRARAGSSSARLGSFRALKMSSLITFETCSLGHIFNLWLLLFLLSILSSKLEFFLFFRTCSVNKIHLCLIIWHFIFLPILFLFITQPSFHVFLLETRFVIKTFVTLSSKFWILDFSISTILKTLSIFSEITF